jgi:cation diffusion facilitator CzcD-associated flavoprotein CzcO
MGVACDIPAHAYQYSFAENTQWSRFYAPGAEIREYLLNLVERFNLRPLMKVRGDKMWQWQ